jgi:hypothetical protein
VDSARNTTPDSSGSAVIPAEYKKATAWEEAIALKRSAIGLAVREKGSNLMWLPPMRSPEFWFRALMVVKAIYDLARFWKSL